jgi:hypothetical protein
VIEGHEAESSEDSVLQKKSIITDALDAATACIWSALSMTVVLSKVCCMIVNNLEKRVVCWEGDMNKPNEEATSSSKITLKYWKNSSRRARKSRAKENLVNGRKQKEWKKIALYLDKEDKDMMLSASTTRRAR